MSMDRSLSPPEWQVQASAGKPWQRELPVHQQISERAPKLVPLQALRGASLSGVLLNALLHSDFDQVTLAERMHISEGYMSRFLKSRAEAWAQRLVRFMRLTGDLGALQWIADQMGCDLVQRDVRAAEIAELQSRLADLQRAGRAAA